MRQENVFVGLGGNIGDAVSHVRQAILDLSEIPDTELIYSSSLYRTVPQGMTEQSDFINAVVQVSTLCTPGRLLGELRRIEQSHGRVRAEKNGPRTLDLDLLLYGEQVLEEPGLTLPHPRMHEREFVLRPLCEIAPQCVIPQRGRAEDILSILPSQGVKKLDVA